MRLGLGMGLPYWPPAGSSGDALSLDFINGAYAVNSASVTLGDYMTVTRSGVATYVDSSGVIQDASANTARFDYAPNGGGLKGLLIENETANLVNRTEEFQGGNWPSLRMAITADTATSPAGTTTADRCLCNGTGGGMFLRQTSASSSGTIFTGSVFLKPVSGDWAVLSLYNGADSVNKFFNVATGALGGTAVAGAFTFVDAKATNYGNGWYRCQLTIQRVATSGAMDFAIYVGTTADGVYSCTNGVSEGLIWGAQLEANATGSSYIRASAGYVTRSADLVTMTGTDFSDWYNQTEGTFVGEFNTRAATGHLFAADNATANEAIASRLNASSNHLLVVDGGATQADINAGSFTVDATQKLAVAYKANDFAACFNGGSVVTDTSGTLPTPTQLIIGGRTSSTSYLNGWVRKLSYKQTRISDSALQAATT